MPRTTCYELCLAIYRHLASSSYKTRGVVLLTIGIIFAGCSSTGQSETSASLQDSPSLPETLRAFPQEAPPVEGERMRYTSEVWGTLVLENECLRLITAEDYTARVESYLIIWPDGYRPGSEGGSDDLVIYDSAGQIAARVGQPLYMGGAEIPETKPIADIPLALSSGLQEPTPPECPGPFWLAGSIEMESRPPSD